MPLRKLLISGMPEPAASGSSHTSPFATVTYDRLNPSITRKAFHEGPGDVYQIGHWWAEHGFPSGPLYRIGLGWDGYIGGRGTAFHKGPILLYLSVWDGRVLLVGTSRPSTKGPILLDGSVCDEGVGLPPRAHSVCSAWDGRVFVGGCGVWGMPETHEIWDEKRKGEKLQPYSLPNVCRPPTLERKPLNWNAVKRGERHAQLDPHVES